MVVVGGMTGSSTNVVVVVVVGTVVVVVEVGISSVSPFSPPPPVQLAKIVRQPKASNVM